MKLRIKGNSIRLRLVKKEVEDFSKGKSISELTLLPGSPPLSYSLSQGEKYNALLIDNKISIIVPFQIAQKWCESNQVGFNHSFIVEGKSISLLIEKDFKCLDPNRLEDESDNFENPITHQQHQNC